MRCWQEGGFMALPVDPPSDPLVDPPDIRQRLDRWRPALVNGGSAVALGVVALVVEGRLSGLVLAAIAIALAWAWRVSPLRRAQPHVPHRLAMDEALPRDVIVYWRPGCTYCMRLRRQLDSDVRRQLRWVNVMADVEASQFIRRFHGGDMVTPTAVTGSGRQVPATAEWIINHVQRWA
jgi:mycoredoxin